MGKNLTMPPPLLRERDHNAPVDFPPLGRVDTIEFVRHLIYQLQEQNGWVHTACKAFAITSPQKFEKEAQYLYGEVKAGFSLEDTFEAMKLDPVLLVLVQHGEKTGELIESLQKYVKHRSENG